MNNPKNLILLLICLVLYSINSGAQEIVNIQEIKKGIQNKNYDIQLANQNIATAKALTSKYNRGYLPTVGLNAGTNFGLNGQKQSFNFNFPDVEVKNNPYYTATIGANAGYLIYDNGQRKLSNERNLNNVEFAQLQVISIKQQLFFSASQLYYNLAQAMYNESILEESLVISQNRLKRAQTYYEYGGQSQVDVLNAEVDVSRDSLNLISFRTDIENFKWQLNQLTLREDINYEIDTSITLLYQLSNLDELKTMMLQSNAELLALEKNIGLVDLDRELASKINSPMVNANGSYNINYQDNSVENQLNNSRSNGLLLGLSANWNVLDGGQRKVQEQLAEINQSTASLNFKTRENELVNQLNRLWNQYKNLLLTLRLEKQNIATNQINFNRVKELFENGQQTSVEFRQAQLNLLNAQFQYYNARTAAKLNEVEIDFLLSK